MESKIQFCAKIANRKSYYIRITQNAVYQYKENDFKINKKIFKFDHTLKIKIVKTLILANGKSRFLVKIYEEDTAVEVIIEGMDQLEICLKMLGRHSSTSIQGLRDIVTTFKKIGEGSFAKVYKVVTNYQMKFALKCFDKKGLEGNQRSLKAYNNQLQIMKQLNSPYVASFDYIFQTELSFYLKMQFLQQTLKHRMSLKLLVKQQKIFMKQLLLGLLQLKDKNIIHRDLKPDNVMIRKNQKGQEECVIIDFGLATSIEDVPYIFNRCGTPGFMSPQIAKSINKNQIQDCSSDMFSLGCIFYKMLTNKYLFTGLSIKEVFQNNKNCQYNLQNSQKLSENQKSLLLAMIDSCPTTRITPEQALHHPYFNEDIDDNDQIPQQQNVISKNLSKIINAKQIKSMESIKSSCQSMADSTLSRIYQNNHVIKGSCLIFQLKQDRQDDDQQNFGNRNKRFSLKSPRNGLKPSGKRKKSRFSHLANLENIVDLISHIV